MEAFHRAKETRRILFKTLQCYLEIQLVLFKEHIYLG